MRKIDQTEAIMLLILVAATCISLLSCSGDCHPAPGMKVYMLLLLQGLLKNYFEHEVNGWMLVCVTLLPNR